MTVHHAHRDVSAFVFNTVFNMLFRGFLVPLVLLTLVSVFTFLSSLTAQQWKRVGLKNQNVHAFTVRDTNIFAAATDGVFVYSNNDTVWAKVGNGISNGI